MTTYNVYQDGKRVATYKQPKSKKRYRSYKEIKQTNERRTRDARLLKAFTK